MLEEITIQIGAKDLQNHIGRTLGVYLLFVRSKKNLSREEVCRQTSINLKSMEKIETGRASLLNLDVGKLLDFYHIGISLVMKENAVTD